MQEGRKTDMSGGEHLGKSEGRQGESVMTLGEVEVAATKLRISHTPRPRHARALDRSVVARSPTRGCLKGH